MFKSSHLINHNTSIKSNYYAEKNSFFLNRIFELKTFASHKRMKYKNKLVMRLYNAANTTKSFWLSIVNPVLSFFHAIGVWTWQGILYISAIPYYRLRIWINKIKASDSM